MCVAVPGVVLEVIGDGVGRAGLVRLGGATQRVDLCLVPEAGVGDDVIVHSGIALQRLDPEEAAAIRALLDAASSAGGRPDPG